MSLQNNTTYRKNSFEPRIAIVQLIFGIIYALVTMVGVLLYVKVKEAGDSGLLQLFFVVLFGILTVKSFVIFKKNTSDRKNGVKVMAKVENVTPTHGITIIEGLLHMPDGTDLPIESRYAGETFGHELKRYLKDNSISDVPALLVGHNGSHPRGMFLIKSSAGHLVVDSVKA